MGCSSLYWKLPNDGSKKDYLWTFYGLHRPLRPEEKIEAKKLFNDYVIAHKLYEKDYINGDNPSYSMWVLDNECNAEENIWIFEEKIK